jgi:hypothetical protein
MPHHNQASGYPEQREHGWPVGSRVWYNDDYGWQTVDSFSKLKNNAFGVKEWDALNNAVQPVKDFIGDVAQQPIVQQVVETVAPTIAKAYGAIRYSPGPIKTFADNLEGSKEVLDDKLNTAGVDTRFGDAGVAFLEEAATAGLGKGASLISKIGPITLPSRRQLATVGGGIHSNITPGVTIDFSPPQVMEAKVRSKWTKQERDLAVNENRYPTRKQLTNNADFRGATGDVQGGVIGKSIRMETRPEYKAKQRGQTAETLDTKTPTFMVPHHRMGIQDNTAFFVGLSPEKANEWRAILNEGGLFPGNVEDNLESVFDGVFTKGGRKEGMFSTDHGEIHDLADKMRKKAGIEINKTDRTLDKIHGTYIKDLPEETRLGLMIQLALQDELIIDQVSGRRMKLFREKFGNLPFEEQKRIIIEEPHLFANLSTNE